MATLRDWEGWEDNAWSDDAWEVVAADPEYTAPIPIGLFRRPQRRPASPEKRGRTKAQREREFPVIL